MEDVLPDGPSVTAAARGDSRRHSSDPVRGCARSSPVAPRCRPNWCGGSSALGVDFTIVLGMTEASPVITQTRPADKAETIGQPLPQPEVAIVDPRLRPDCDLRPRRKDASTWLPSHEGRTLTSPGRRRRRSATAGCVPATCARWTSEPSAKSRAGSRTSASGVARTSTRRKSRSCSSATRRSPRSPSWACRTRRGASSGAFVRPAAGQRPIEEELFRPCRDQLSPHKTPRIWVIVEDFPLTASGKIQKYVLRDRYLAGELR